MKRSWATELYSNKTIWQYTKSYGNLFKLLNHKTSKVYMSKFINSIVMGIGVGLVLLVAIVYGLFSADDIEQKLFGNPDIKKEWVKIERGTATYSTVLDEKWVKSILDKMKFKVKLRDTLWKDRTGLDFAYEVSAFLSRPVLSKPNSVNEVDYRINLKFKLIDEDGFIIGTVSNAFLRYMKPDVLHEWYAEDGEHSVFNYELKYLWSDSREKLVIAKGVIVDEVQPNVAKKIKKIICEPDIDVMETR